ncbi:hypothetical protein T02_2968 [Trichinella nativa]|uniref:Uncharacterized protein n=1 Tax=Trichinella nativa TaxID=6335 RepID=A0A0V1KME1_9BILA|nr:hypothetical protein T02_2968 [Trichinella nativa]
MVEGSSPNDDCDSNPIGATHHSPQKEGRLEMYLTECLEKLEDFSWPNGVPTSNYGVVKRYLLSDPKELLNTYGPKKSFVELSKRIHPLRQRESQIIKQCAEEVAKLGIRACVSDRDLVALLAGGAASREVYRAIRLQDPPTLAEAHKGAEEIRARQDQQLQRMAYEPLGVLDVSAAAAWTITDVTPPSYASENER